MVDVAAGATSVEVMMYSDVTWIVEVKVTADGC